MMTMRVSLAVAAGLGDGNGVFVRMNSAVSSSNET